jgi:hypothetical protein
MIELTYTSSNGTVFNLLSWDGLKTEKANFHKYKWGASVQAERLGEKIVNFTKGSQMYEATFLFRGLPEARRQMIEDFHFCTEYDIAKQTPGRITWGSDYIECYITQSSTAPRDDGGSYTENTVSIYCPYPFWIEEQTISIFPQDPPQPARDTDKGYPQPSTKFSYPYPYSYSPGRNARLVNTRHYDASNFKLVCYGATDSVEITMGGHLYNVNHAIGLREYMVIDSRPNVKADKKCYLVNHKGEEINCFNDRNPSSSLFQKLPGGTFIINYNRGYGIVLTLYKERSEPRV